MNILPFFFPRSRPKGHPYEWILELHKPEGANKPGGGGAPGDSTKAPPQGSLVKVAFQMLSPEAREQRGADMALKASVTAVKAVFLYRCGCTPQPPPRHDFDLSHTLRFFLYLSKLQVVFFAANFRMLDVRFIYPRTGL